jgi:hypothetical protein
MMRVFTYLPSFATVVCRGLPTVWRGRHRFLLCWLVAPRRQESRQHAKGRTRQGQRGTDWRR